MSFHKSLKQGKIGEKVFCDFLESAKIGFSLNTSSKLKELAQWDVRLHLEEDIDVEIKLDAMASKTGNMAIEYYNSKLLKPSGIDATSAKLWVVVFQEPNRAYVCSVERLKGFIKRNKPLKTILNGGDNNASLYLYKLEKIFSIFRLLDKTVSKSFLIEEANWKPL